MANDNKTNDLEDLMNLDNDISLDNSDDMDTLMNLDANISEELEDDGLDDLMALGKKDENDLDDLMNLDQDDDLNLIDSQNDDSDFLQSNDDFVNNEINRSSPSDEDIFLSDEDEDEELKALLSSSNDHHNEETEIPEIAATVPGNIKDGNKIQKLRPKYFKYLIIALVSFLSLITVGMISFYSGIFESEEKVIETKAPVMVQKKLKNYKFNIKDINVKRLNKKLSLLTKAEILLLEEEKRLKEEEEKRLKEEKELKKQNTLEEKVKKEQERIDKENSLLKENEDLENKNKELSEELIQVQKDLIDSKKDGDIIILNKEEAEIISDDEINLANKKDVEITKEKELLNSFLLFIEVRSNNKEIYKSFIDKLEKYELKIELCRDQNNEVQVLLGSYNNEIKRNETIDKLKMNLKYKFEKIDLTYEEFNKRCNY